MVPSHTSPLKGFHQPAPLVFLEELWEQFVVLSDIQAIKCSGLRTIIIYSLLSQSQSPYLIVEREDFFYQPGNKNNHEHT